MNTSKYWCSLPINVLICLFTVTYCCRGTVQYCLCLWWHHASPSMHPLRSRRIKWEQLSATLSTIPKIVMVYDYLFLASFDSASMTALWSVTAALIQEGSSSQQTMVGSAGWNCIRFVDKAIRLGRRDLWFIVWTDGVVKIVNSIRYWLEYQTGWMLLMKFMNFTELVTRCLSFYGRIIPIRSDVARDTKRLAQFELCGLSQLGGRYIGLAGSQGLS